MDSRVLRETIPVPRVLKAPKANRDLKETKGSRENKAPREIRGFKENRAPKEIRETKA